MDPREALHILQGPTVTQDTHYRDGDPTPVYPSASGEADAHGRQGSARCRFRSPVGSVERPLATRVDAVTCYGTAIRRGWD